MHSLWMIVASLFFAGVAAFVKLGADRFSTAELVFYRSFIALLVISAWIVVKQRPLATSHWKTHLTRSLAGFSSMVGYFYAIRHISLGTAVTLNYTSSLFLAALVVLWWRERVRPVLHLSLLVGFAGIFLLLQPAISRDQWQPALAGGLSGLLTAIVFLNVRSLGRLGEPEWRMVFYFSLYSSLGGLAWMLADGRHSPIDGEGVLVILGVGGCGVIAQLLMALAYMRGKALVTANLGYLTVVFSALFGWQFWGEQLDAMAWAGMVLVIGSGIASTLLSRGVQSSGRA